MSATNSTPNYGLPQYIGTDVPSYLGDFNSAMLKIDNAIKGVDNKATSAESAVATANSNANQALENSETAQTTAETAQATAQSAQGTANTAKSSAEQANTTANSANSTANTAKSTADNLNTSIKNWVSQNIGVNNAEVMFNGNKLLNFIGISCNVKNGQGNSDGSNTVIGTLPEGFRPSENRTINGACIVYWSDSNSTLIRNLTIKPDGTINCPVQSNFTNIMVQVMLCTANWGITE